MYLHYLHLECPLPGYYCPSGVDAPLDCDRGQYCDVARLDIPAGDCTEGFYCDSNSIVANPVECSLGHYCPTGTVTEQRCPPGTFLGD